MPSMNVVSSPCPDCVIVALSGDLDIASATGLAGSLSAVTAPGSLVILDLAELAFIDCGALRTLAAARMQALAAGGDLLLADPRPPVRRILSLIDLSGLLPVFASVTEAASEYREASDARLAG